MPTRTYTRFRSAADLDPVLRGLFGVWAQKRVALLGSHTRTPTISIAEGNGS